MVHKPVMLAEVLEQLAIRGNGWYLDCTFGRGGHSRGILERLGSDGRVLAIDRDLAAIHSPEAGQLRADPRFQLVHGPFSQLLDRVRSHNMQAQADGILLDLGVSSPQLDESERGFSFMHDGPLDMRMDTSSGQSAKDWLARVDERELADVLFHYGEERFARRIAKNLIEQRQLTPIATTRQLANLIADAVPKTDRHKHPATRSFQAIRIKVNGELDELNNVLEQILHVLKPGGRLVVISFHSLEDRIVKRFIRAESGAKHDPGRFPVKQADIAQGELIKIGKAIKPSLAEQAENPRARSAVLRVAEKRV